MIPKILEYEDGRIKITPQAYALPEIKALIDKYDMKVEPYLMYVYYMAHPESPVINLPEDEIVDSVIYDLQTTLGEFDFEEPLLQVAVTKFKKLYTTKMIALAEELGNEIDRIRNTLKNTPITMGGQEDNMKIRMSLLEKISKISAEYMKVKEQADKDLKIATKGDHEVGEYYT
jgi:hypothetical protein